MKTSAYLASILATSLLSIFILAAQESPPPTHEALRVTSPLRIDGVLDEQAWQVAEEVGPFLDNASGEATPLETSAWVLYDEEFLYFAFEVEDANVWATMTERDDHLWTEEVVEVFLQPSLDSTNYIELEVNPLGTMIDIYLLDIRFPLRYRSWNAAGLQWAVSVDGTTDGQDGDTGWTCEIAFPLADAVTAPHLPPEPGDTWRMNLYRVEKLPEPAGLAWAPTYKRDFHVLEAFGSLVFSEKVAE